ncbi:MAG: Brp/Blh family beta-carotene 15,15'-dioxygenase [Alphaproteobacteria bacterium]|nr:Brp/Blh family beta-carotene 15,15'-dioxygenase [Alphaproteobacteria bacterium]
MMAGFDLLAMLSLAAVVMIGMPHGAMDGAVAITTGHANTPRQMTGFILRYLALTALVVVVWMVIPIFTLTMFMLISLIHFGLGDHTANKRLGKTVQVICHGGLVVGLIPAVHFAEVEPIFLTLTGAVHISQLQPLWGLIILINGVMVIAGGIYAVLAVMNRGLRRRFAEWLALLAAISLLPPLTGFALYFCCVHTPRHILAVTRAIKAHDTETRILPLTIAFTIATWIMAAVTLMVTPSSIEIDDAVLRVVFIGLAALTVPHMILVDGVFRPKHLDRPPTKGPSHDHHA